MARRRLFNQCFYITYENTKYFPCIEIFSTLPMATANLAPEGGEFVFSLTSSHVWEVAAAKSHPFFNIIEVDGVEVTTPKRITGESGTHVIKVRVGANPGTNPRQGGLYVTQFLNKDHMSAAAGSLFSGDLYSRRITVNIFEQGSGAYVLINNSTTFTENISYDTTSRQYTIAYRGGWHFVDASIGQSCTSNITGVTTTDEGSTLITVTYGQNTGGSDREFLFQIVSNQDSSIVASAIISQAGLALLDLERVDNDTLPWVGTNVSDATTWPSLPRYYTYWYRIGHNGQGYVYTYSGSNLINVSANTPVDLTLPSRISVSENPITGSGSYIKQISFSGAPLDSGLTDITGYTYLMSGVSSVDSSVQDTVSFHYEPWPYIEVTPQSFVPGSTPGQGLSGEADTGTGSGNDGYAWADGAFIVNSACTGFSFELASNYEVRENPDGDMNTLFNVTLTGRKVDIKFKYNPESASTDVTRLADFVVSGLSGPIVSRRFPITRQAAHHTVTHYLEVDPISATISSAGTLQLKAWYHTVTDGVDGEPEDVTTSTTWVDMSDIPNPFFTVGRNTGLVTGTNTIENAQTGRVVATYNTYTGETSITVLGTGTTTYYLEVTPATATIGPTGTTNLTAKFYTIINGVPDAGVDVTSLAVWSSDNTAATVSAGVVTGQNNNPNSSAVANITATYNGYSDDSVITVQPAVITYDYFIIRPQGSTRLTTGDTVNGQPVTAEITKYINGVEAETLDVTNATTWGVSDSSVITAGTAGSNPQHVYPVYESGTYYPNDRTAELSGTCVIDGETFRDTQSFVVSPEGRVEYLLTVRPQSTSLALNETQRLTVMYYTITDGVSDAGVNVTGAATYSNYDTSLITVSSNGLITDINAGSEASTTITVAYGNADNVTVSVLTRDTETTHTVELTPSMETFTVSGVVRYTVQYVTYVNGQETNRETITGNEGLSWNLTDTANIATFNGSLRQMFVENLSTTNRSVELQAIYRGTTSNTATVTVRGATTLVRYLDVDRDTARIPYNGSVQVSVSSITEVNGDVYGWTAETPQDITWTMDPAGYGSMNGFTFTADNTGHTEIDQYLYAHKNAGTADELTGSTSFIIEAKPDVVEYKLRLLQNGDSNLSQTFNWNGRDVFTIVLSKYVNDEWDEDIREITTTGDGATWTVTYPFPGQHADTYTTWDDNTQTLQGHNLSNQRITVNVSAAWGTGSTRYTTHVATVSFEAPSSIVYGLIVDADSYSVAYNGSTPVSATYVTYVEGDIYEPASVDVTTDAETVWSVSPTGYGSVSNGTFYGNNATDAAQTVTVTATYNNLSDSVDITVGTDTVSHRLVVVSADDQVVYNGSTQLTATYQTLVGGVVYSQVDVTTNAGLSWSVNSEYASVTGSSVFQANNTTHTNITVTVTGTYLSETGSTTIEILGRPDDITYGLLLVASTGSTSWNGEVGLTPYHLTYVNGVEDPARRVELNGNDVVWFVDDQNTGIATLKQNIPSIEMENLTNSNVLVTVYFTYDGMTANTVNINVSHANVTYRFDVESNTYSINYNGQAFLTGYSVTIVNGTDYRRESIAPENVTWSDDSIYASVTNGVLTANNNTNTAQTVTVTGTYNGLTGNAEIVIGRQPVDYTQELVLSPATSTISNYYGSVDFTATYRLFDNGVLYLEKIVDGREVSTNDWNITVTAGLTANITQSITTGTTATLNVNNTSDRSGTASVTLSYTYSEAGLPTLPAVTSNIAAVSVARKPVVSYGLEITPAQPETQPYSGSLRFTAWYCTYEDNVRTVSADVTSNAVWSVSSTDGDFVHLGVNGDLVEFVNLDSGIGTVTVNASYTVGSDTYTGSTEFDVAGVDITTTVTLTPADTTVAYGNTVDYQAVVTISHNNVQKYSATITSANFDSNTMSISSDEATYAVVAGTPMRFLNNNNTSSDETATITFTWGEGTPTYLPANTVLTAQTTAEVVKQVIISYEFEITPKQPGTQPYSDSLPFTAKLYTCENGTRVSSVDVTSNVSTTWSCTDVYGNLSVLNMDNDVKGLVHFVNLTTGASNTGRVTVSASYGIYSDSVTFDVSGLNSLNWSITVAPNNAVVNYGDSLDYTAEVIIYHNNETVYRFVYYLAGGDSYVGDGLGAWSSSDEGLFEQSGDYECLFTNVNPDSVVTSTTVNFIWGGAPSLVPDNVLLEAHVSVTLNPRNVTPTYSATFTAVNPVTIDTVSYRLNGGTVQSNNNVSTLTVNQLSADTTITWSAVTAGYVTKTGTTTVTGNNIIPINMTPNQFSFGIAPKDSGDTNVNVFGVSVSTTNGYSNNFMMQCSGTGRTQVMVLPVNYITDDNDTFTFVVTRGDGVARIYDWRSTGSLAFTNVDPSSLNDMLQNLGFSYATNINLKYNGQYTYNSNIIFEIANAPVGFNMDCTIYRSTTSTHSPGTNSAVTVPNEYIVLDEGFYCPFDCDALDTTQYYRYVAYTYTGDAEVSSGWIAPTLTIRSDGGSGSILYTGPVSECDIQLTDRGMEGTRWTLTSNN